MLHKNPRHNYIVYPSWSTYTYRWENLPAIFADLFGVGRRFLAAARDEDYYLDCGYPLDPQPYQLYDGTGGGGIVLWEGDVRAGRGWRWMPIVVLGSETNIRGASGMEGFQKQFEPLVFVMEPRSGGGFGRPKEYFCPTSLENVDEAGDDVYWVVCSTAREGQIKGLETLFDSARGFGLDLVPADAPEAVRGEFDRWIPDPELHRIWFKVQGGGTELGYHYASLVYAAYRLKFHARKKLVSMHLVSQIEEKPNILRFWNWDIVRLHYY